MLHYRFNIIFITFLLTLPTLAAPSINLGHNLSIVGSSTHDYTPIQTLILRAESEVNHYLGNTNSVLQPLFFNFNKLPHNSPKNPHLIHLQTDGTLLQLVDQVIAALIWRRLNSQTTFHERRHALPMAWITAGITFSVLHAPQSVKETKHPNYQPARILFLKNQFPSVANLLNHPAPTQTELPYTLYSMHCHLILQALKTIQRQDKLRTAPVQQICQLITDGRPPLDALNFCIAPYLKFDETIQQWYEREVIRESTRGRRPLTSQHIMQRVQKLERVPLVLPGQALKREKRLIALDELPKTLKKYGMDNHIVYQLTREFFELMSNAPPLLQPALQRYIEALQRLSQGKTWGFGRRIRKARAELVHSCDHQNRIVSYMNNLEGNTLTLESLFPHYYKAWQSSNSQRRELDPDLHIYLDQLQQ